MSDRSFSSNTIDRLLHLAVTSVSSLYRIGCCLQHLIIKEGKSLLKIRGMELRENLAKVLKTGELGAKLSQLFQGCICTTASVEESIDFRSALRSGRPLESLRIFWCSALLRPC